MFVEAEPDPTVPSMSDGFYWCTHTMNCLTAWDPMLRLPTGITVNPAGIASSLHEPMVIGELTKTVCGSNILGSGQE
jgi:hypothetical protein